MSNVDDVGERFLLRRLDGEPVVKKRDEDTGEVIIRQRMKGQNSLPTQIPVCSFNEKISSFCSIFHSQ